MRLKSISVSLLSLVLLIQNVDGQIPLGRFTEPRNISSSIDENTFEFLPVISPTGTSLMFSDTPCERWNACQFWQNRQGGVGGEDIWIATRSDSGDEFSDVQNLREVNSEADDDIGGISADGLTIFFGSNQTGNWDLYQAIRPNLSSPFEHIRSLGSGVNTDLIENSPVVTADGLGLFFHRRAAGPIASTPRDIMFAERESIDDEFGEAVSLGEAVNQYHESFPSVSADGSAVFFSDWDWLEVEPRPGGFGGADIWVTLQTSDGFAEPINLNDLGQGSSINTPQREGAPYISADWPADGSKLLYVTDFAAGGFMDIYEATWEVERLGDLSGDGLVTVEDIDLLSRATQQGSLNRAFDFDGSGMLDVNDRIVLVEDLANTFIGDSNLDGVFDSGDFVKVFQAAEYEDGIPSNSAWATGDWNGDFEFDSADFVFAFQRGGYEKGPRAEVNAVPEPTSLWVLMAVLIGVAIRRRSVCGRRRTPVAMSKANVLVRRPLRSCRLSWSWAYR